MPSIRFKCAFDAISAAPDTIEKTQHRAELMIKARDLIENAGGILVKNEMEQSSALFLVPSDNYDSLLDQLDDLVLEDIVRVRKDSKEIEICIDEL